MSTDVEDDSALLEVLLVDAARAKTPWNVTSYWRTYFERGVRAIQENGLSRLQTKPLLLKGFAEVQVVDPMPPRDAVKRAVFQAIPKIPIVSKVISEYRHVSRANAQHLMSVQKRVCQHVLDQVTRAYPDARPRGDLVAGAAPHRVEWHGQEVSTAFVPYLARVADFYSKIPAASVSSLLEVGPGLSWSTLAHLAINPNIRFIVNVDIPSTLYIATQFLKATGAAEVVDYTALKAGRSIRAPDPGAGPLIFQLPPWHLDEIDQPVDWFHNAFSFMEMEPNVVDAYGKAADRLATSGAWVMSTLTGHAGGAGGQRDNVNFDVIDAVFREGFKHREVPVVDLSDWFAISPEMSRIYFKSGV